MESSSAASTDAAAAITRGIVGLIKGVVGRGPLRARTYIHSDMVVCVLEESMTQSELTLVAAGQREQVRQMRFHLQDAFAEPAIELVEATIGRRVLSFLSDHDVERDVAAEVFVLEPLAADQTEA